MHPRLLRQARRANDALAANDAHQFAAAHALNLYAARAIYTYIPKNGCSTMRLTLAVANGAVRGAEDVDWIHKNNQTFAATLRELVMADYSFVVLRDPFRRLASCFLDKFVSRDPVAWAFQQAVDRGMDLGALTFERFVAAVCGDAALLRLNEHWRPQADFLVYERYDDWFALERFGDAIRRLRERIGVEVCDARALTRHGTEGLRATAREGWSASVAELAAMRRRGEMPAPAAMFSPAMIEGVRTAYAEDIDLYRAQTGLPVLFDAAPS